MFLLKILPLFFQPEAASPIFYSPFSNLKLECSQQWIIHHGQRQLLNHIVPSLLLIHLLPRCFDCSCTQLLKQWSFISLTWPLLVNKTINLDHKGWLLSVGEKKQLQVFLWKRIISYFPLFCLKLVISTCLIVSLDDSKHTCNSGTAQGLKDVHNTNSNVTAIRAHH